MTSIRAIILVALSLGLADAARSSTRITANITAQAAAASEADALNEYQEEEEASLEEDDASSMLEEEDDEIEHAADDAASMLEEEDDEMADDMDEEDMLDQPLSLDQLKEGMRVMYKGEEVTVESFAMEPMVTVTVPSRRKTVKVPLSRISTAASGSHGDTSPSSSSGGDKAEPTMNIRQRVVCDVCLRRLHSCSGYTISPEALSPYRPAPERNLGRLVECKPSEREYWTRTDRFKVSGDDVPEQCPSERRRPLINGKGDFARNRICKYGLEYGKYHGDCTALVEDKVPNTQGRKVECTKESLYIFGDSDKLMSTDGNEPSQMGIECCERDRF
eukprot:CAMPEP_0178444738 /NCGR_PEP_ID=MMETSP0689_2-20121128/39715_1 /TAXON_ID=160604 /ORGANISM="Amphidinium massartii, Strain CS-259" /LENGTH=332 /DNA_ID=CAMNT_0020069085 /DNA_START=57 /DNA_END=1056 /DNA_ORIENTATION=-